MPNSDWGNSEVEMLLQPSYFFKMLTLLKILEYKVILLLINLCLDFLTKLIRVIKFFFIRGEILMCNNTIFPTKEINA